MVTEVKKVHVLIDSLQADNLEIVKTQYKAKNPTFVQAVEQHPFCMFIKMYFDNKYEYRLEDLKLCYEYGIASFNNVRTSDFSEINYGYWGDVDKLKSVGDIRIAANKEVDIFINFFKHYNEDIGSLALLVDTVDVDDEFTNFLKEYKKTKKIKVQNKFFSYLSADYFNFIKRNLDLSETKKVVIPNYTESFKINFLFEILKGVEVLHLNKWEGSINLYGIAQCKALKKITLHHYIENIELLNDLQNLEEVHIHERVWKEDYQSKLKGGLIVKKEKLDYDRNIY